MLINARPRFVPQGFEALVPTQRAEFLHRRLIEMTNNEVNAWSVFRPVATSTDNWDQNLDDLSTSNFPVSYESIDKRLSIRLMKSSFTHYMLVTTKTWHPLIRPSRQTFQRFPMVRCPKAHACLTEDLQCCSKQTTGLH